jgi:hypothetical protein
MYDVVKLCYIMDQPFPVLVSYRKVLQNLPGNTATSGRLDGDSIGQRSASGNLTQYTLEDIPRLADYSASLYATSPAEYAAYQQYYQQYYRTQISQASIIWKLINFWNVLTPSEHEVTLFDSEHVVCRYGCLLYPHTVTFRVSVGQYQH